MARAIVNVPATAQARRGDRDPRADRASDGDRLPRRRATASACRATSCAASPAATWASVGVRARALSGRRGQPVSSRSTRSRPRAARSRFTWEGDDGFAQTETVDSSRRRELDRDASRRPRWSALAWSRSCPSRRSAPTDRRAPLGLRVHGALDAGDAARRRCRIPAMLWVGDGEALWRARRAARARLRRLPRRARRRMRGVAARYPAYDTALGRPVTLGAAHRRVPRAPPAGRRRWRPRARELLGLEGYVALQSRGMPIAPPDDPRLAPFRERGRALSGRRHRPTQPRVRAVPRRQRGQAPGRQRDPARRTPPAYPIYRLEWQGLGSLERRLRGCMTGVRAEPAAWGSADFTDLQVWLAWRAKGMAVESPGVRP